MARLHKAGNFRKCVQISDRLIAKGKSSANDYQIRGWCLLELKRPAEAQLAFRKASIGAGTRKTLADSSYGEALAALRSRKTDDALNIASRAPLRLDHRNVVDLEILRQRTISAFRSNDHRSTLYTLNTLRSRGGETRDLSHLRGWSYYYLGDYRGALSVFTAIDGAYSTKESRRAIVIARRKLLRKEER